MVLGNVTPVLHAAPRSPLSFLILARVPDALAPDDVFEVERIAALHDPLGHFAARRGRDLSSVSEPESKTGCSPCVQKASA